MKNKFKKSKIIVPALALITATTAASVTGTVAWFTATRAVTVTAGEFVATKLESKLNVDCSEGNGTIGSGTSVTVDGKLTHGSYNAIAGASGSLYVAKLSDDGTTINGYTDLGAEASTTKGSTATTSTNKWLARVDGSNKTWYGVSWKMSFTLEEETTGQTDYVCFDPTGSSFSDKTATTTAPGIRIAIMSTSKLIVLGNDTTKTHTSSATETSSFGNEYINLAADHTVTKETDDSKTLADSTYNLGVVSKDTALEVTCVAWYEGSDPNVVDTLNGDAVDMSTVTSTLSFYTRYIRA